MVVPASSEKYRYAKAALEPLVDELPGMATVKYWLELKRWEKVIAANRRHVSDVEDPEESSSSSSELASDAVTDVDVEAYLDVEIPFSVLYPSVGYAWCLTYVPLLQISLPDLEMSERSQAIVSLVASSTADDVSIYIGGEGDNCSSKVPASNLVKVATTHPAPAISTKDEELIAKNETSAMKNVKHASEGKTKVASKKAVIVKKEDRVVKKEGGPVTHRNVDLLNLPPAKPSNTARKRLRQTQFTQMDRKAVLKIPGDMSISAKDTVEWANSTHGLKLVRAVLEGYPPTLTDDFLLSQPVQTKRDNTTLSGYD
ncbi:hypothetical protein PybrP1_006943 [[Pythium] brassicae (nom. inval.)]|nr:hypothetical protein PybrP1_006943 [[Pythium] brassicae (nom. inval.)]